MQRFFADAPVMNPDGSAGIQLIIDRGQGGLFTGGGLVPGGTQIGFDICAAGPRGCGVYDNIVDLKNSNFAPERLGIFKYLGISAGTLGGNCGGEARFPWFPPSPGDPDLGGDNSIIGVTTCGWNSNMALRTSLFMR